MYPMTVEKYSAVHRNGTKQYTMIAVTADNGKSLLITRWSKVGQAGQLAVERHPSANAVMQAWARKFKDKFDGAYDQDIQNSTIQVKSEAELQKVLGMLVFPKLGADNLRHIAPDSIARVKEPEGEPTFVDGKPVFPERKPKLAELEEINPYANNEKWGMF